jgi:hypothetical protein
LQICQVLSIVLGPTLGEWNEITIIRIHRIFVVVVGFGTGNLICLAGGAMCRPTPLKLYFLQEIVGEVPTYEASLLTNLTMFAFASVIIVCQLVIETKRWLVDREEKRADDLAAAALKQIQNATSRMESLELHQIGVQFLPRLAWQEVVENMHPIRMTKGLCQTSNNTTLALALKISRCVTIFGIVPTILTIVALSLENIDSMRPHGVVAFMLSVYGIVIPLIFIISNKKMRKFAKNPKIRIWFN